MQSADRTAGRVRLVTIDAANDGQRIDNYLSSILKGVPRSLIYRVLRRGEVRVNKGRIKPEYRLRAGDQVRIPPVRVAEDDVRPVPTAVCERLARALLWEDDALLVLDKPEGLAVHAGSGLAFGVIEALRQMRPQAPFLELVHRLDRETSGCLLLAKSRVDLLALQEQLKGGQTEKAYLALTRGAWSQERESVVAPLRKNVLSSGERMVMVSDEGRHARTEFTVVTRYPRATLVEALLDTGRTHQIRVHAAHMGHPLAGDGKYGDDDFNKEMRTLGLKRMFLHAHRLGFRHPRSGEWLQVRSPLPAALQEVLQQLESAP